jgi:hypothetical protein
LAYFPYYQLDELRMESDSDGRWGVEDLSVFQKVRTLFVFVLPICGRKRRSADGHAIRIASFFFPLYYTIEGGRRDMGSFYLLVW